MAAPDPRRLARLAALCCAVAAPCEGLREWAYADPGPEHTLTICYGHTGGVKRGDHMTPEQCRAQLAADMGPAIAQVVRCAPGAPDGVVIAFADLTFNAGPRAACDREHSAAARLLAAGRWREACEQLPRWNSSGGAVLPGLVKRRALEREICLQGVQ